METKTSRRRFLTGSAVLGVVLHQAREHVVVGQTREGSGEEQMRDPRRSQQRAQVALDALWRLFAGQQRV